jgi:transcriptional regulator with XRE-family HTH domain
MGTLLMLKFPDPFCVNVKKLREQHGLSIDDLALAVGIPAEGITRVEAGTRPSGLMMLKIACALDTSLQALQMPDDEEVERCTIIPKPFHGLEECQFCERVYHPMMRWTLSGVKIFVCDAQACKDQAWEAGFEPRPDLTPSR